MLEPHRDARPQQAGSGCRFCGAAAQLVPVDVVDLTWCRRFGAAPVVSLDHGWYWSTRGGRVPVPRLCTTRSFTPTVRTACDFCVHGWMQDVRARAEPSLLSLADGGSSTGGSAGSGTGDRAPLVRWAQLTAVLAELIGGMPVASTPEQRDGLRRGRAPEPEIACSFFATRQRLPARLHLSQVPVGTDSLVQVVTLDLSHLTVVVTVPSDERALDLVRRCEVGDGNDTATAVTVRHVDLARAAHPHASTVGQLCSTSRS